MTSLKNKLVERSAVIGVMGLGYVGLPLTVSFAEQGYRVIGFDTDNQRVQALKQGQSHIPDVPNARVQRQVQANVLHATTDFDLLAQVDVICICVPTPLRKSKDPDVSYIVAAVDQIKSRLRSNMLIVLESTTFPGTTNELVKPELESTGLLVGKDLFLCFSPERIDPGNRVYGLSNTPKVVGGVTPACTELGVLLYQSIASEVIPVSTARSAEMVKILENTFRAVNIALVNELALVCERMGIDVWEVVDAAATKPFGFMPFYPGPGIGGHCIPLDPMYLAWKAKTYDVRVKFIDLASDINGNMPYHVVHRIADALNVVGRPVQGSRILCLGVAYKPNVGDVRESPALEIIRLLRERGADVTFNDPFVPAVALGMGETLHSVELSQVHLQASDCTVLCTNHGSYDYRWIASVAPLIVDTRNAFKDIAGSHIVRIGTSPPVPEGGGRDGSNTQSSPPQPPPQPGGARST